MEKLFKLKENKTNVRTEIIAGFTTFLAMVFILAVNPSILSAAGMEPAAVFTATAVSAAISCMFMAFFANYPIALHPAWDSTHISHIQYVCLWLKPAYRTHGR